MSDDTRERARHAARDAAAPPNGSDGNLTMLQPDDHLDAEMLSAWLDAPDDFSEQDRLAIETHLATCADCTQIAAELTAIVRALEVLPLEPPPRSFALTQEMAGLRTTPTIPAAQRLEEPAHPHERKLERESRKPTSLYERAPWYERQMQALRWATAVAVMLFVFFVSVDVLGNLNTGNNDDDSGDDQIPITAAGAAAEPTATTSAGSAAFVQSTPAAANDEAARSSQETATSAPASGAESTTASGAAAAAETTGGSAADEGTTPESAEAEASPASTDDAMTMMTPADPEMTEQADQAQQQDQTISAYSGNNVADENQESSTLHLIELALAIVIAWLIVAMIALPRLRRTAG